MIAKRYSVFFLLTLFTLSAYSIPPRWQIIPAESQLTFTATQNGAPVSGQFKQFSGNIVVDPNDLKNSSIDIVIDINSINVPYEELRQTLLTADWFNVKIFPKAEFKSQEIKKNGNNSYLVKGTLTIRDKSDPVTLKITTKQIDPNKEVVFGTTVIKRSLFGVGQGEWASTNEIKDEITINFKVVGVKN